MLPYDLRRNLTVYFVLSRLNSLKNVPRNYRPKIFLRKFFLPAFSSTIHSDSLSEQTDRRYTKRKEKKNPFPFLTLSETKEQRGKHYSRQRSVFRSPLDWHGRNNISGWVHSATELKPNYTRLNLGERKGVMLLPPNSLSLFQWLHERWETKSSASLSCFRAFGPTREESFVRCCWILL